MSRAKNKRKAAMARRKAGPVRSIKGVPLSVLERASHVSEIDRAFYNIGFSIGRDIGERALREQAIARAGKKT